MIDRATWLADIRRENEAQEDALADEFDQHWGEIGDLHRSFVGRFLDGLPPSGRVLDAACGTGKYFGMVLGSGRSVLGVDHAGAYLARAAERFPDVPTDHLDLQELSYRDAFDGVMCVDAMEFVPPEDWPVVLQRFRDALHPGGSLYLTVELHTEDELRAANEAARGAGHPVVEGEVLWQDAGGDYYHHHPSMERVRSWLASNGFEIVDEREGPWDEGYAYHHLLCRSR